MAKTIYEKIEEKALEDAKEIKRLGEEKALNLQKEVEERSNLLASKMIDEANVEANNLLKMKKNELLQENNQLLLKNRKKLIQEAFLKTLTRMQDFNDQELQKYVVKQIKEAKLTGKETIKVSSKEQKRYLSMFSSNGKTLDKLNNLLGSNYNLTLSNESVNIPGGFIVVSDYFDIDYSYETVLKDMINDIEKDLSNILFEG